MINDQNYAILSLELHLFFARQIKEHALFLRVGFMPKDADFAKEAEHYKNQFEKLLALAVSASNGVIRPNVLNSGEIITDYTLGTEAKTQALTGINIDQSITTAEANLRSGNNPQVGSNLVNYVNQLNVNAVRLLNGFINFQNRILNGVLSCNLFTANYPLFVQHLILEAQSYLSLVNNLQNRVDIESRDIMQTELLWDQLMMQHALFIRGLLDPTESDSIDTANEFADDFRDLIEQAQNMTNETINSVTNQTLNETVEFRDFKEASTDGIARCKIRSMILPLLADHVLREANHYIRLLQTYTQMQ